MDLFGCQWNGLFGADCVLPIVTAGGNIRMNSEAYRSVLSAHSLPNAVKLMERHFAGRRNTARLTKEA